MTGFARDPLELITGDNREWAIVCLIDYMHLLRGRMVQRPPLDEDRTTITARDLVAVTTLGVDVPEHVSIWLLDSSNQTEIDKLLGKGVHTEDSKQQRSHSRPRHNRGGYRSALGTSATWLWTLLQQRRWPSTSPVNQNGVGPVTAGKFLAATSASSRSGPHR